MAAHRGRKTAANDKLALLLASGETTEQAAVKAGVSQSTLFRRLKKPEFRAKVDEIRAQVMERTVGRLSEIAVEAAEALGQLVREAKAETTKVHAIRLVLEFSLKGSEQLTLIRQIQTLKAEVEELRGKRSVTVGTNQASAINGRTTQRNGDRGLEPDSGRSGDDSGAGGVDAGLMAAGASPLFAESDAAALCPPNG